MPYGYEEYRLSKGISPNTTYTEVRLIKSLLAFVNHKYKRKLEPREIKPSDVREFILEQKQELGLKDSTIKRKMTTIRNWYDYLWRINKIEHDFMEKFTLPIKLQKESTILQYDYESLLSKKNEILRSSKILLYAKMLFILYMRGFRVRDIVVITLDYIEDHGDKIIFSVPKQNGCTQLAVFTEEEIPIILSCMERAIFRGTPYLMSSKVDNEYVPLQIGSFKDYLNSLKEHLGFPFRSEEVRLAYVHYLYTVKHKNVEELQEFLGMKLLSVSQTLKESLERVKKVNYN